MAFLSPQFRSSNPDDYGARLHDQPGSIPVGSVLSPVIKKFAASHQKQLDKLRVVVDAGSEEYGRRLARSILASYSAKICGVVRTIQGDTNFKEIVRAAGELDLFDSLQEPVQQVVAGGPGRAPRFVLNFGPCRRAAQRIVADVLDVMLPRFEFDHLAKGKGPEHSMLRLQHLIEEEGHDQVVVADVKSCFRSVDKEKIVTMLPIPHQVTRHTALVGEDVTVTAPTRIKEELFNLPMLLAEHISIEADTAARQGLPQGGSTSSLIMSRAVLGPLLAAAGFSDRLVLYGDDIAICAKGMGQARETFKALRSSLENSPAGPLSIGRHSITPISEVVNFTKYGFKRTSEGPLRIRPSWLSYQRYAEKVKAKALKGDPASADERVSPYRRVWPLAFPLWEPTPASLDLLWVTTFEAQQDALQG